MKRLYSDLKYCETYINNHIEKNNLSFDKIILLLNEISILNDEKMKEKCKYRIKQVLKQSDKSDFIDKLKSGSNVLCNIIDEIKSESENKIDEWNVKMVDDLVYITKNGDYIITYNHHFYIPYLKWLVENNLEFPHYDKIFSTKNKHNFCNLFGENDGNKLYFNIYKNDTENFYLLLNGVKTNKRKIIINHNDLFKIIEKIYLLLIIK